MDTSDAATISARAGSYIQVIDNTQETGPRSVDITDNQKLNFCQDITKLQFLYQNAGSDSLRTQAGYILASLLYRASYEGDCWYLTLYDWSCADTVRTGDRDLILDVINYLNECSLKGDKNIQFKSLYALAFIRRDNAIEGYPYDFSDETDNFRKDTRQYKALAKLAVSSPSILSISQTLTSRTAMC